ncbi:MAG: family 10 glycosylhydrolase, partial [Clostridia bacterium]|nr:family 10 glycosylhydrolase [Clostridia bacterium]
MFKRIISMLLAIVTLCALCACGGNDTSNESSTSDSSKENVSESESSENKDVTEYKDKEGYEQFLKVSKVDKVLEERGFLDTGANSDYKPLNYDKMKAMWICQFDFDIVYQNGKKQRGESQFRMLVKQAYDNLLSLGFNTVIVQVRPNADCFYPSAYYPYSHYILGEYGGYSKYDPLKVMIELAHEKGLSFHAWINPMRGMSAANLDKIDDVYPVASWTSPENKDRCANYLYERKEDSLLYLNIAYEEVRDVIIDAAAEIVRHYDVDGVHMDDYFYFGEEPAFDQKEFDEAKKKDATLNLRKFRYEKLNTLVSGIYSAIKAENKNVWFGISPAGNIDKMPTTYFADVETWLSKDGYVDYIMPQIYFGMEHQTWSFPYTYERWAKVTTNPNIKFYVGMTLGKAVSGSNGERDQYAGSGADEWINNKDVFKKSFEYSVKQPNYDGFAIFCYKYLWHPTRGTTVKETEEELNN